MANCKFLDAQGTFSLENPELTSYLYFPLANEAGVMSSITPDLSGDHKTGQNSFLLSPVSSEDLHNNKSSRNFWCTIEGKGIWSATGKSAKQQSLLFSDGKEATELEAGIMWHKVKRVSSEYGIQAEITSFVPCTREKIELMRVVLKNISTQNMKLQGTAAIPIYGRSADNLRDHRHVTALLHRIETLKKGVVVNPTLTFDERGHQKNQLVYGVFGGNQNESPIGFYPVAERFIGEGGSYENPRALLGKAGSPLPPGEQIDGYEAMGGICFEACTLKPLEEKTYIIAMGIGALASELEIEADRFLTEDAFALSLAQTKEYWKEKINIHYVSESKNFDAWMYWVNFQPMLRRIFGCSFLPHHDYGKGGRGWRDLWQDCLALLMMNPDGVRSMLIDNLGGVRFDGTNATIIGSKQGEFIADRNNITRVWMDHGVWPFITTDLYIQQSGDIEILLEKNYYFKDKQVGRGELKDNLWTQVLGNHVQTRDGEDYQGTVLEHILLQHVTAFYDVGEHNHIKMRGADWNDALDMAKEHGESVAFTAIYGSNLENIAKLLEQLDKKGITSVSLAEEINILISGDQKCYGNSKKKQELLKTYCECCKHTITGKEILLPSKDLARILREMGQWIKNHIKETEWIQNEEGFSWFNGYYDNHGNRVEGDHPLGTRMMLTSQVFTIMSKTALDEQVREIVKAANHYLFDEQVGGYRLNTDFHELKMDLGRMYGFAYGHKENGAVFSHMAVMFANALYQRGFAIEGYKVINSLYKHCSEFSKSKIYPGIPEYIEAGGRGVYHYLTGAASWLLFTVLTEMYGVKGKMGDLCIQPQLVLEQFDPQHQAAVEFTFAERKLRVIFRNPEGLEVGRYKITNIAHPSISACRQENDWKIRREDLHKLGKDEVHPIIVELSGI